MGATKRMSNGEAKVIGPHPSTIKTSRQYVTQATIEKQLSLPDGADVQEKSQKEARDDSVRLQGVTWLDNTRRALQLPVRTFTTACVYYHKFRLAHPTATGDYLWADAAAASLLQSCKVEDTLKKSKDILAAAWNLKAGPHEQLGADDTIFETPSKNVIGLERLVLESGAFDFRSRYPHAVLLKICKSLGTMEDERIGKVAWTVLTDLHRTFAPLKQTSATLAIACLELSAHLNSAASGTSEVRERVQALDIKAWSTTRDEIMETLLDALDLYTHHTTSTILGTKYSLDDFLRIRLALNKECTESNVPRFTTAPEPATSGATLRVANGHPTPVSPPPGGVQPTNTDGFAAMPENGGTLRFVLNPELAADEKAAVQRFCVEEWEEYEEEIEIPIPRPQSRDQERERRVEDLRSDRGSDRGSDRPHPQGPPRGFDRGGREYASRRDPVDERRLPRDDTREQDHDRENQRNRDRDRELERERARARERDRERRYDDRRYDERDRYDRRERFVRRYDDDRRRRDDRR